MYTDCNSSLLLGGVHSAFVDDFKESTLPSLSKKKSSMPPKVCVKAEDVVLFGRESFFWSLYSDSVPPCIAIWPVIDEHATTLAGLFVVFTVTGNWLFQFSLAAKVCFLSIPGTWKRKNANHMRIQFKLKSFKDFQYCDVLAPWTLSNCSV